MRNLEPPGRLPLHNAATHHLAIRPVPRRAASEARGFTVAEAVSPARPGRTARGEMTGRLQRELREMSGRVVDASERERTRIARDLHDDVAQRLALIATGLSRLRRQLAGSSDEIQQAVSGLSQAVVDVCSELHRVSHELHPARLEQLGLEGAVRAVCVGIAAATGLIVRIETSGVPNGVDRDVALCIYRVAQEALHNVVKHSGASRATVTLTRMNGDLVLRVTDQGAGFATDAMASRESLGFTSMRERALVVAGRLRVASRPAYGTTVELLVPMSRVVSAMKSAG